MSDLTALLGVGTEFEGRLVFDGQVRIDGAFKGEIRSNDTLVIGDSAVITADIVVGTVIVRGGTVVGNIRAKQAIEIHSPAKVKGDLHSPSIFIDRGVQFQGACRMDAVSDEEPAAAAEAPAGAPDSATV